MRVRVLPPLSYSHLYCDLCNPQQQSNDFLRGKRSPYPILEEARKEVWGVGAGISSGERSGASGACPWGCCSLGTFALLDRPRDCL